MEVTTNEGVRLMPIPVSPNDDYMAGEDGQIYSRTKHAGFGKKILTDWYPLKGHNTGSGYKTVSLCHQNRKVSKNVHRLVCMAFHGMPARTSLQVRHLDGNPDNNKPTNLAWGTQVENCADRKAHGRYAMGEDHPQSKFTNEDREHLVWALRRGLCSKRNAARVLGVAQSTIQKALKKASSPIED